MFGCPYASSLEGTNKDNITCRFTFVVAGEFIHSTSTSLGQDPNRYRCNHDGCARSSSQKENLTAHKHHDTIEELFDRAADLIKTHRIFAKEKIRVGLQKLRNKHYKAFIVQFKDRLAIEAYTTKFVPELYFGESEDWNLVLKKNEHRQYETAKSMNGASEIENTHLRLRTRSRSAVPSRVK